MKNLEEKVINDLNKLNQRVKENQYTLTEESELTFISEYQKYIRILNNKVLPVSFRPYPNGLNRKQINHEELIAVLQYYIGYRKTQFSLDLAKETSELFKKLTH